jgi:hypothetical protein
MVGLEVLLQKVVAVVQEGLHSLLEEEEVEVEFQ